MFRGYKMETMTRNGLLVIWKGQWVNIKFHVSYWETRTKVHEIWKKFTNVYEKCDLKFWKNLGYGYNFEVLFIWNQHYQKVFLKTLETLSWTAYLHGGQSFRCLQSEVKKNILT